MLIREATIDDADRITEIYLTSRKRYLPYAPLVHSDAAVGNWIREQLIPSGNVSVIIAQERVEGFVAISKDGTYGWIDHLYLDPAVVGRGWGAILLERAKLLLTAPVRLYTFQQNTAARRFYLRHGFREVEFSDGSLNEEKTPDVLLQWS